MDVLMFYLPYETLISSLISSVVTHLTLKHSLSISSYLAVPTVLTSLLPTGELEVADSVWEDVLRVCLFVCVFWMLPLYIYTCMSLCVCTACVSVNVCDRCQLLCQGWGRTLPSQPRCLQRFVSTQQIKGEHLLPLHTHWYLEANTPNLLDVISLYTNSGPQDNLGKKAGTYF